MAVNEWDAEGFGSERSAAMGADHNTPTERAPLGAAPLGGDSGPLGGHSGPLGGHSGSGAAWPSAPATGMWDEEDAPLRRPARLRNRRRLASRLSAAALLAGFVVGGATGGGIAVLAGSGGATASTPVASAASAAPQASAASLSGISAIVNKVEPALVDIETQGTSSVASPYGAFGGAPQTTQAAGTGMILNHSGLVLTNFHVIAGASTINVVLNGQHSLHPAKVVGTDPSQDVALIQIQGLSNLPTVNLGSSTNLAVGASVVAIGNALNLAQGTFTVSQGIVSALNRSVQTQMAATTGMIQTDAAISSGDSGGPLLNSAGQVIGMDTAAAASAGGNTAQNIGFAISVHTIKSLLPGLEKGGTGGATTTQQSAGGYGSPAGGYGSPAGGYGSPAGGYGSPSGS